MKELKYIYEIVKYKSYDFKIPVFLAGDFNQDFIKIDQLYSKYLLYIYSNNIKDI